MPDLSKNGWDFLLLKVYKTESEKFAGAVDTYCIEALMQDGKALQAGTSHFLGQNFAKAFDVRFTNKDGKLDYVWATSWGVSTRLVGALVMAHSDDNGLVLPPKLAPVQVVIIPIYKNESELMMISNKVEAIRTKLINKGITVKYDDNDNQKPGWKFAEYELKGIPVRIAVGPRDILNNSVEIFRRDTLEKMICSQDNLENTIEDLLVKIQENIFRKALKFREQNIHHVDNYNDFRDIIAGKGGFVYAHWDGTAESEAKIKEETKATIRCIPGDAKEEAGSCIISGKLSTKKVIFAKSY